MVARPASRWLGTAIAALGWSCDVPEPSGTSGGVEAEAGIIVVGSDYQSTNVSVLDLQGRVLSPSLVSSASAPVGLSFMLSGDVVAPTAAQRGERIVLIDRYPAAVLTWVQLRTAQVRAQLSVATGFFSNPHDYLQISPSRAYVTRFDHNFASGQEPHDLGSDLLAIDPSVPRIVRSVDLRPALAGEPPEILPRADKLAAADDRLYVLLSSYSEDFLATAPSRIVAVDTRSDEIESVQVLQGLHGCSALALSPNGRQLAVACSGQFQGSSTPTLSTSGVVLLGITDSVTELARYRAADFGEGPIGLSVCYAGPDHLLFTTLGRFGGGGEVGQDDTLISLDAARDDFEIVLRSAGQPFTLGDVRCATAAGRCFVADAMRGGVVHRLDFELGRLVSDQVIRVETEIGLPPRHLGEFCR